MHAILWASESCDCNKDEYDWRNALCLWNPKNHCFRNAAPSLPQSCAAVSATPKFDYPNSQISERPECTSITAGAFRSIWECSCWVWGRNGDRRAMCNATRGIDTGRGVIRHRRVSDSSDGARQLWRSHSSRTEMVFADAAKVRID